MPNDRVQGPLSQHANTALSLAADVHGLDQQEEAAAEGRLDKKLPKGLPRVRGVIANDQTERRLAVMAIHEADGLRPDTAHIDKAVEKAGVAKEAMFQVQLRELAGAKQEFQKQSGAIRKREKAARGSH